MRHSHRGSLTVNAATDRKPDNHLDHGISRNPETGKGSCVACDWTGPFYMADVHLNDVKRRWEARNRARGSR